MQQATKTRILEFTAPVFVGVGFIFKMVYIIAFGWWLDPWIRRSGNRKLLDDIAANLHFLVSDPNANVPRTVGVFHSEFPTVEIPWGNLFFTVVRWRDETIISVAPRHAPEKSYQIGPVVAALESRNFSERDVVHNLTDAARVLRPRLQALNAAFSEEQYPRIRDRL
jgi:hypothetical protein